jgi:hypothetical protein
MLAALPPLGAAVVRGWSDVCVEEAVVCGSQLANLSACQLQCSQSAVQSATQSAFGQCNQQPVKLNPGWGLGWGGG